MASIQETRSVLHQQRAELMSKPNVFATGIGYKFTEGRQTDQLCIKCSVDVKKPKTKLSAQAMVPKSIGNIPTDVDPMGMFYAYQDPKQRFRPAPGGVSIGHFNITAGTLGCWVKKGNQLYILSNNHVMANSNDASVGDAILQPGPTDGGRLSQDRIATLTEFIPIHFDGEDDNGNGNGDGGSHCSTANAITNMLNAMASAWGSKTRVKPYRIDAAPSTQVTENLVDAAIALPDSPDLIEQEILEIGNIAGINEGELGMEVKKSGRTTGFTTGQIQQIDVTAQVNYGSNRIATFTDQLMTGGISQGGDSGSAVLDNDNNLVGLLFAGSPTTTLINRIQNVFSALDISLPD